MDRVRTACVLHRNPRRRSIDDDIKKKHELVDIVWLGFGQGAGYKGRMPGIDRVPVLNRNETVNLIQ